MARVGLDFQAYVPAWTDHSYPIHAPKSPRRISDAEIEYELENAQPCTDMAAWLDGANSQSEMPDAHDQQCCHAEPETIHGHAAQTVFPPATATSTRTEHPYDSLSYMTQSLTATNSPIPDQEHINEITNMTDAHLWTTITGAKRKRTRPTHDGNDTDIHPLIRRLRHDFGTPSRHIRRTLRWTPEAHHLFESHMIAVVNDGTI